jgi:hypothetical protein
MNLNPIGNDDRQHDIKAIWDAKYDTPITNFYIRNKYNFI